MPFSISNKAGPSEVSDAVNYLLANFAQIQAVNPNSGQITTSSFGVVGYLYKYLNVKYADSFDGQVNFSNSPTNRLYYGLRNNDSSVESTLFSDYVWTAVPGGFGTTKFFWYATSGGRQIQTTVATTAPAYEWAVDPGTAIDLDLVTLVFIGVDSFSAGTTGFTPSTPTTGAVVLAGTLKIANGGTNGTATPTSGAVAYGTSTAYAFTAAGTVGQVLTSNGSGTPTWKTLGSTVLTKTADYTIADADTWIINNKTGSALTLTFPAAASWIGRYITVKNMQVFPVNSASSNIVPIDSTTAGTAILLDVVGNWATLVSDGTNWVIMQAASNNNLLLE